MKKIKAIRVFFIVTIIAITAYAVYFYLTESGCSEKNNITPEKYGAVGKNITFRQANRTQAYIDSVYRGMPVTLDDNIDWAAVNYVIQYKESKRLIMKSDYYINKPIRIPKYQDGIMIDGNNYIIHMISSSDKAVFMREEMPSDLVDAEKMTTLSAEIKNLKITCASKNTSGIQIGASRNSTYSNIYIVNANIGIHLQFTINTTIKQVTTIKCNTGIKISYYDTLDNNPATTSCMNNSVEKVIFYADYFKPKSPPMDAIYIDAGKNTYIKNVITEGMGPMRSLITIDATDNVAMKQITMDGLQSECINGYTDAMINIIRMSGTVNISDITNYSQSLIVKAIGYGPTVIDIRNVLWSYGDKEGKQFYNENCGWVISGLSGMMFDPGKDPYTSIRSLFSGITPYPIHIFIQSPMVTGYNQIKIL